MRRPKKAAEQAPSARTMTGLGLLLLGAALPLFRELPGAITL